MYNEDISNFGLSLDLHLQSVDRSLIIAFVLNGLVLWNHAPSRFNALFPIICERFSLIQCIYVVVSMSECLTEISVK